MSDSEDIDELEQNENVQNISVFRKREKINNREDQLIEMDSLKKLNYMLTCPICLDIFQEPVYVKGCSHRFCKECIEKAIRSSKTKQCPTCRKIIGTKRHLRVDFNVQEIIKLIYGDISKFLEQKQTNDEMLISKAYQQIINNIDGNTRKKRKNVSNIDSDKIQDNYQQFSPKNSSSIKKEDSVGKAISNNTLNNAILPQNYTKNDNGEINNFSQIMKKKHVSSSIALLKNSSQKNQNNDKIGSSQFQNDQQSSSRKRKYENINNQIKNGSQTESINKKGEEQLIIHNMSQKKRFYAEEYKEKHEEEEIKNQNNQDLENGYGLNIFSNGNSSTNATSSINSSNKIELAFINIQLKVIPQDKVIKSFDFNISQMDWTLTLDDLTKLICYKLSLNYSKFKPYIKFYIKSKSEETIYHCLEDKSQLIKHVEDQFWSIEIKNRCFRKNDQIDYSLKNEQDKFKFAQNRKLYYMIDHKDTSIQF